MGCSVVQIANVDDAYAAMERHLNLVEEYNYFQGTTTYIVHIRMGDSAFSMNFAPNGNIALPEMRARCLRVIIQNVTDIHDSTCNALFAMKEGMHSAEIVPGPDGDYN